MAVWRPDLACGRRGPCWQRAPPAPPTPSPATTPLGYMSETWTGEVRPCRRRAVSEAGEGAVPAQSRRRVLRTAGPCRTGAEVPLLLENLNMASPSGAHLAVPVPLPPPASACLCGAAQCARPRSGLPVIDTARLDVGVPRRITRHAATPRHTRSRSRRGVAPQLGCPAFQI